MSGRQAIVCAGGRVDFEGKLQDLAQFLAEQLAGGGPASRFEASAIPLSFLSACAGDGHGTKPFPAASARQVTGFVRP